MMRQIDVEEWAFRILTRIQHGQPTEDSLVELKGSWPAARDIARQLAGHANSAQGQPIMWLFGVDEKTGIVPVSPQDPAVWRDQLAKEFDGFLPPFIHYNLQWSGLSFTAFVFETDAAPFVVLNPNRGQPNSGPFDREVPWREGRTRSATRGELILIARPPARLPIIEVVEGKLTLMAQSGGSLHHWDVNISLYGVSESQGKMFFPVFGVGGSIEIAAQVIQLESTGINAGGGEDPHVVFTRNHQLVIDGAGRFRFYGQARTEFVPDITQPAIVVVGLKVAGNAIRAVVQCHLRPTRERQQFMAVWLAP